MLTIVFLLVALVLFVPVVRYLLSKIDEGPPRAVPENREVTRTL